MNTTTVLSIPGAAADHLYREGSAKASFWEVLFGSRLAAEKRTKVSSLDDGTRRFDVPMASVEAAIWANARSWFDAQGETEPYQAARHALARNSLSISLVGLQPRGVAVASFHLRIDLKDGVAAPFGLTEGLQNWFNAERSRLDQILLPFGFAPHPN